MNRQVDEELVEHGKRLLPETLRILREMHHSSSLPGGDDGALVAIDQATRIRPRQGAVLHRLAQDMGATSSLEIGLAYGFSTAWLLDALSRRPGSSHVAIDPFQRLNWNCVGIQTSRRLGLPVGFDCIEERSDFALAGLAKRGARFDFCYIDGNHRFDDVLVDFYLCDQVTRPGGIVVLDDMEMPSIRSVAEFIRANRAYEEIETEETNLAVFRKRRDDDRDWRHFEPFKVHRQSSPTWRSRIRRLIFG